MILCHYQEASTIEEAPEAHILMQRGNLNMKLANKVYHEGEEKYNEYVNCARLFFSTEALSLAQKLLGDHELTWVLHKLLGDICFDLRMNEHALRYYTDAMNLRKTAKVVFIKASNGGSGNEWGNQWRSQHYDLLQLRRI